MNTQTVSLNLSKAKAVGQIVRIGQADSEGTTIEAHVYDGATPANLSEATATFCMRLPDGTHFVEDGNCTISGNVVTYVVDEEHCAVVEGYTDEAYFRIDKGGSTYSTARFRVKVFRAASSGASVPESYSSEVEELIEELDDAIETATDAANVANAAAANADATADGVESRVQEMAQDAAETATADAEQRIQDAIDAMGDISELAVPLMSKDTRGGAKLEEHGGLVLRDEKLGIGSLVQESDGTVRGGIAELTAKGHAEQDGTPTPESPVEIQVVRGRNLLDISMSTGLYISSGTIAQGNVGTVFSYIVPCERNTDYTLTHRGGNRTRVYGTTSLPASGVSSTSIYTTNSEVTPLTFNSGANDYLLILLGNDLAPTWAQLTLGSTPQPYVPYGHVGMEARDPDTDELISCTALPLPSRGWVGSLPDGTADVLTLDGAGKVTWELETSEVVLDSVSSFSSSALVFNTPLIESLPKIDNISDLPNNATLCSHYVVRQVTNGAMPDPSIKISINKTFVIKDGRFATLGEMNTWLSTHNVTVLYLLATPVTEDCGYIDPPSIEGDCTISIPELDELGVRYFVDDSAGTLARQWAARLESQLGDAIVELAARVAVLES